MQFAKLGADEGTGGIDQIRKHKSLIAKYMSDFNGENVKLML